MNSMIEVLCNRTFETDGDRFVPGQHEVRILDPRPHRDRADMAAILTYVDDQGRGCDLMCFRYRDERGWRSIKVTRGGIGLKNHTTAADVPELTGHLLELVQHAAQGAEPWPFEEPSEDEQSMRRLAHALMDEVERKANDA